MIGVSAALGIPHAVGFLGILFGRGLVFKCLWENGRKQKQKQFEGKGNSWYVGIVSVELIVGIIMSNFQFTSLLRVV